MAIRRTIQSSPKTLGGDNLIAVAARPTIIAIEAHNERDAEGALRTIVEVVWRPPVNRQNFSGVHAWIENPDFSGIAAPPGVDEEAAFTLDETPLSPAATRQDMGRFAFHAADMDVAGLVRSRMPSLPAPKQRETWRLYLEGYNASYDKLIPLPDINHSPTGTFDVDPAIYAIGEEYAPLVTDVAAVYELLWSVVLNKWQGRIKTTWHDPDPARYPDRIRNFMGVVVTFEYLANGYKVDLPLVSAGTMVSLQDYCDVPPPTDVRVWVRSAGIGGALNTINDPITPHVTITTLAAPDKGDVSGFDVSAAYDTSNPDGTRQLVISTAWTKPPDDPTFAGIEIWCYNQAAATWNILARQQQPGAFTVDERLWPVTAQSWDFYAVSLTALGEGKHVFPNPGLSPKKTVAMIPYDLDPGTGEIYALNVTSFEAASTPASTADGVDCFQFGGTFNKPNDRRYKAAKIVARPAGSNGSADQVVAICGPYELSFLGIKQVTPAAPTTYTLYALSGDASGNFNPITPGHTPEATVIVNPAAQGTIKMPRLDPASYDASVFGIVNNKFVIAALPLDKAAAGSYDPAVFGKAPDGKFKLNFSATQFDSVNGYLRIKALDAATITTGTLAIGGTGRPGLSVYNASNALIGWVGNNGSFYGGWFKNLWAGGSSPADAKLRVDDSGNLVVYGTLYGTASNFTGELSASQITSNVLQVGGSGQATGVYAYKWNGSANQLCAWMGANGSMVGGWFKNLWIGGVTGPNSNVDPGDAKIYLDNSGAAWFTGNIFASAITGTTLSLTSGSYQANINTTGITFKDATASAELRGGTLGLVPNGWGWWGAYLATDGIQVGLYLANSSRTVMASLNHYASGTKAKLMLGGPYPISLDSGNGSSDFGGGTVSANIGAFSAIYENGQGLSSRYAPTSHTHSSTAGNFNVGGELIATSGITVGGSQGLGRNGGYPVDFKDHAGVNKTLWFLGGIAYAVTG